MNKIQRGQLEMLISKLYGVTIEDEKRTELENNILNLRDASLCVCFVRHVAGADLRALENAVLKCNDAQYSYLFAKHIPGADIKAHERVVMNSKSLEYNRLFSIDFEGTCVEFFEQQKREQELNIIAEINERVKKLGEMKSVK